MNKFQYVNVCNQRIPIIVRRAIRERFKVRAYLGNSTPMCYIVRKTAFNKWEPLVHNRSGNVYYFDEPYTAGEFLRHIGCKYNEQKDRWES